jgi:hypothetical protein
MYSFTGIEELMYSFTGEHQQDPKQVDKIILSTEEL